MKEEKYIMIMDRKPYYHKYIDSLQMTQFSSNQTSQKTFIRWIQLF